MDQVLALWISLIASVEFCIYTTYKSKLEFNKLKSKNQKILSQKKSSEVRTGHIAEKFAPFLESFPHDPESAVFLGQPIDYIVFEDEGVTFSEIKSGNSQLSSKQKQIRDNIKNGNVYWEEIRIK